MTFIFDLIFGRIAKALDGYKTKIGGAGLILLGVTGLIGHYWPDAGVPPMDVEKAMGMVATGLSVLGLGHKAEKTKQALLDK